MNAATFVLNGLHLSDGRILYPKVGFSPLSHFARSGKRVTLVTGLAPRTDPYAQGTHLRQHVEFEIREDGRIYDSVAGEYFGTLASLDQAVALQDAVTLA